MFKQKNISNPSRASASALLQQETGDTADVRRVFGWRETFTYAQFRLGNIKGYLIPTQPGRKGKRTWDFQSIRNFIARCEAPAFPISANAHRPRKTKAPDEVAA